MTQLMTSQSVFITGGAGYVGSMLVPRLIQEGHNVTVIDLLIYGKNVLQEHPHLTVIKGDIRNQELLRSSIPGHDVVIHLACISNDPSFELNPKLGRSINLDPFRPMVEISKNAGVKRFVYASSQSMYGISDTENELDEENSEKNPLTAYARTKWEAELEIKKIHSDDFVVVCFRPSTVFGASPRLRCDIVYNNLVACAYTTGKIEILSDGSPWRPVVHVRDVCQAFIAGLEAPTELVGGKTYNVGIPAGNFTVRELAEAAQRSVPGSELIFLNEHTDPRTYRVSFKRILSELKDYYQPEYDLDNGGKELVSYFDKVNFTEDNFRGKTCNRLAQLEFLQSSQVINNQLRFNV